MFSAFTAKLDLHQIDLRRASQLKKAYSLAARPMLTYNLIAVYAAIGFVPTRGTTISFAVHALSRFNNCPQRATIGTRPRGVQVALVVDCTVFSKQKRTLGTLVMATVDDGVRWYRLVADDAVGGHRRRGLK